MFILQVLHVTGGGLLPGMPALGISGLSGGEPRQP